MEHHQIRKLGKWKAIANPLKPKVWRNGNSKRHWEGIELVETPFEARDTIPNPCEDMGSTLDNHQEPMHMRSDLRQTTAGCSICRDCAMYVSFLEG